MTHWLTVHYPPETEALVQEEIKGIWSLEANADRFSDLAEGDLVAIYETRSGPARWLDLPDGTRRRSRYLPGRGGVIALARVTDLCDPPQVVRAKHDDGTEIGWVRLADAEVIGEEGLVPLAQVNSALGRAPGAVMRGFGGLKRITPGEYQQLAVLLGSSSGSE